MFKKLFIALFAVLVLSNYAYAGVLSASLASSSHSTSTWSNNNKVAVSWTKPAARNGDPVYGDLGNVTGYSIKWDTTATTMPDTSIELDANATTTTSNPLTDGQNIYLHIRVIYDGGSPLEADHLGPFWIDATAPSAPSSFSVSKGDSKLTLSWTNPGSSDFAGVVIRRDTSAYPSSATAGTSVATVTKDASPNNSYTDTSLTNGTTYYYSIFAYDHGDSQNQPTSISNYSTAAQANAKPESTGSSAAPPTVSSTNPANKATDIPLDTTVQVAFSNDMNSSTIFASATDPSANFVVKDASGTAVSGTYSYNSTTKTAKFTPSSNLGYGKTYSVTLFSGSSGVKDSGGNGLDGNSSGTAEAAPTDNYSFSFTIVSPPKASSTTPASGATAVSQTAGITIVFSKAMDDTTISGSTITLKDGSNNAINGAVAYNSTDKSASFTPTSSFAKGALITVTIKGGSGGVKDTDGIQFDSNGDGKLDGTDGDQTFSFTILSTLIKTISLASGWNLISSPVVPADASSSKVLNDISNNITIVWEFTAPSAWKSYIPTDYDPGDSTAIHSIDADKGYWIKTKNAADLVILGNEASTKTISLSSGWNLVGYKSVSDASSTTVLNDISNNITIVWEFTPPSAWKSYIPTDYDPGDSTAIHKFVVGKGYWIKTKQAATLTLP